MALTQTDIDDIEASVIEVVAWAGGSETFVATMPNLRQVPSPAKVIADSSLYKVPAIAWPPGGTVTDATQAYTDGGLVYAPQPSQLPFTGTGAFPSAKMYLLNGVQAGVLAASGGSALVGYQAVGIGAILFDLERLINSLPVSIRLYGALPAATVAVNTAAIQAAWDSGARSILYPGGDYLVNKLTLPSTTIEHRGEADPRAANRSRLLFNPAGVVTDPMIELSALSGGNGSSFKSLTLDTNDVAAYGFYLASGTVFQAIKNMLFELVEVNNLKSGAVGWQIGDETNTGLDTDAFNFNFRKCAARGSADSIAWVIDAANAFNISWRDCFNGRKDGSNFMLTGIKTIRGSGFRLYNYFGDKAQSTGAPWVIDHNSGAMSIYGMNTEDHRVIKARTIGRSEDSLNVDGVQVNDSTGDNGTVVDTTMITSLTNCIFDTSLGGDNRIVKAANRFYATNVSLGSAGEYKLTGEPRQNVIEGLRVGALKSINFNSIFDFWVETGADKAPSNWRLNKGSGTATIQQATLNANIGQFTTHIDCSAANAGDVMGISMFKDIDISAYRNTAINLVAIATRVGTETMEVECLVDGVNVLTGGTTVFQESASGDRILAWGRLDIPDDGINIDNASLKVGLPSGQTGELYVDAVAVVPFDWSARIPALWVHMQYLFMDHGLENLRVNDTTNQTLVNSGAVSLTTNSVAIVTTGAASLTLADGTNGQELTLVMTIDGGDADLVPDNLGGGTSLLFTAVDDTAQIKFLTGAWRSIGGNVVPT